MPVTTSSSFSSACTTCPGRWRRWSTPAAGCAQISPLWCLPQGLVGPDPEPVGTLLRPATLVELARRAGFGEVTVLDIEHPFWRFYRLQP